MCCHNWGSRWMRYIDTMSNDNRPTLAGHLARSGLFSRHSEYLCTLGLGYLLNQTSANGAFAAFLSERLGVAVPSDLRWVTEAYQEADAGRPDLEGRSPDKTPVIKIEAKLGALLDGGQLRSYAKDLAAKNLSGRAILIVLVPTSRLPEATGVVASEFAVAPVDGAAWRVEELAIHVVVLSWHAVLAVLGDVEDDHLKSDLAQLRGLYLTLSGLEFAPVTRADLLNWRDREADFKRWVEHASRRFFKGPKPVYPMADEHGFFRRYVYPGKVDAVWPEFSVGVRQPFAPHATPIWLRVSRRSPLFAQMYTRLKMRHPEVVESEGHLWLPIEVSHDVAGDAPVDHIEATIREIFRVALADEA